VSTRTLAEFAADLDAARAASRSLTELWAELIAAHQSARTASAKPFTHRPAAFTTPAGAPTR
jgi:hypothetical protein